MKDEVEFTVDGIADIFICEFLRHKFLGCSTITAIDLAADNLIREGKIAAQNTKERAVKSPNKRVTQCGKTFIKGGWHGVDTNE